MFLRALHCITSLIKFGRHSFRILPFLRLFPQIKLLNVHGSFTMVLLTNHATRGQDTFVMSSVIQVFPLLLMPSSA